MMKILVASENPVKIESTKKAFLTFYNEIIIESCPANSKVSNQPLGIETFQGAKNRALNAKKSFKDYDYYIGIEGGAAKIYSKWFTFGVVSIIDKNNRESFGFSPGFELPEDISNRLKEKELGELIDEIANEKNSKQKTGAIGFFTKDKFSREDLYVSAVIMALVPFLNENLFFRK